MDGPGARLTLYLLTFDALTLHPLRASAINGRRASLDALLRTGAVLGPRGPALCLNALARLLGTGALPLLLDANALTSLRPVYTDTLLAALGGFRTSLRSTDALLAALGSLRTSLRAAGALLAAIGSLCLSTFLGFLNPLLGIRPAVTWLRLRRDYDREGRDGGDQE